MKTITLSPSQYRVVQVTVPSTVECSNAVPNAVECSSTARASRMSQSSSQCQATAQATDKLTAPATATSKLRLPDTHPIYGLVNLALLAVIIYLLWANL